MADAVDVDALKRIVGPTQVLEGGELTAAHCIDWTGRFRGHTPAVVRPGDVDEVAAVLAHCNERGVAVVPQGGNTGLVGGSVPLDGELVLSLRRLRGLGEVDLGAGQLTVGAGATLAEVQDHVHGTAWEVGLDLGARMSATLGGMVATNAGGMRVLRHGTTRHQLIGAEAVTAEGSVLRHLAPLVKDNTGYFLPSLLCGSEGTLAVVSALRLRLVPRAAERVVALVACPTLADALELTTALRLQVAEIEAIEAVIGDSLALVCEQLDLPHPFAGTAAEVFVVTEAAGRVDPTEAVAAVVGDREAHVASDPVRRAALWAYRERMAEAIATVGVPHKLDVTLPHGELAGFVDLVEDVVRPGRLHLFGHLGDGNLHVNVTGLDPADESVDERVLGLVSSLGGSISAEHGIGRHKRNWLHLNRSPEEIGAFRAIKRALDPNGILNPGVLLPA